MSEETPKSTTCPETKRALLWMAISSEPLSALYTLLPFILRKDLGASLFELSLFACLRPLLSVFSFYWGARLRYRKDHLLSNLIGASILSATPFLLLPFCQNIYFVLFAAAMNQLFTRAGTPALIEILKRKIPKKPREHLFSLYYIISFIESGILGLCIGKILDLNATCWTLLFFLAALVHLSSVFVQMRVKLAKEDEPKEVPKHALIHPWQESFALMRKRKDFAHFQLSYMIGGFALMLMYPAQQVYFADILSLSHTEVTTARFIFMAVGVAISSLFWKKGLEKLHIHKCCRWLILLFGAFAINLLLASFSAGFFYMAFLIYGVAQAGSHIIWNLSGTIFAEEQDSAPFTGVNLLMVGLRGAIAPLLGGQLCYLLGPMPVILISATLCFLGARLLQHRLETANLVKLK